jgi:hypothetical protein
LTTDERIDRLTGIVESLAGTVVAHDRQIGVLLQLVEEHRQAMANLERQ